MADDIYDLFNNLKRISKGEREEAEPMTIEVGTVKKLDPFTVDMGQYTIEEDFLVLTRTIKGLMKDKKSCHGTCSYGPGTTCRFGQLKVGDAVVLLKDAGGDDWLVLDAVEVDDDE